MGHQRSSLKVGIRPITLAVRADEGRNRDVNHGFASELSGGAVVTAATAPYPPYATDTRLTA
jgi:ubiquinol oxidase